MIVLHRHKIAYWPVPGCASTSIKTALLELVTGFCCDEDAAHEVWPTGAEAFLPEDCFCFAVVRDPIERFVSMYQKWIVDRKALGEVVPVQEFVSSLQSWRHKSWVVDHHMRPMTDFLGSNVTLFHLVLWLDDLGRLPEFIEEATGHKINLPQAGGGAPMNVDGEMAVALREIYQGDYDFLKGATRQ